MVVLFDICSIYTLHISYWYVFSWQLFAAIIFNDICSTTSDKTYLALRTPGVNGVEGEIITTNCPDKM
jgi:glycogen synthase